MLLQHSSNSICFFLQIVCVFNSVEFSAGKSAAGLLMVMLACLRGMLVSNLHIRDLAVTQGGVSCTALCVHGEKAVAHACLNVAPTGNSPVGLMIVHDTKMITQRNLETMIQWKGD